MATVGYGDIVPITVNETIFAIIALLVTCGMFAYVVGSIGLLVSKYSEDERIYREKFVEINTYMKNKKIPLDLQFRTRRYLEYIWDKLKIKNISEKDILQLLSESLKDEVFVYTRGTIISNCKVFVKFSSFFIQQLGKILESHTFAPADIIFEEGEKTFCMYFIRNGEIELFQQSTGTVLKLLKNGKYCGVIALFCNSPRCCSGRSVDFLEALVLEMKSFETLLEKNPDAMKIFEILKGKCDQGDFKALDIRCYLCAEDGHVAKNCQKFHLKVNDEKLKKKWIKSRNITSKLINPDDSNGLLQPKKRQFDLKSYNVFNVIGAENHNKELFKDRDDIIEKVNKFYEENDTVKSPKASVSSENNVFINSMRKNTSAESQISNS